MKIYQEDIDYIISMVSLLIENNFDANVDESPLSQELIQLESDLCSYFEHPEYRNHN